MTRTGEKKTKISPSKKAKILIDTQLLDLCVDKISLLTTTVVVFGTCH